MEVVDTYEVKGELRGKTSDGREVRWDDQLARWQPFEEREPAPQARTEGGPEVQDSSDPFGSPWREATAGPPKVLQQPGGLDDSLPPTNPIDEAFNRVFPPFSRARLVLGIALLPVVGLAYFGWRRFRNGEEFSLGSYLFTLVSGILLLALTFGYQWWKNGTLEQQTGLPSEPIRRFLRHDLDPFTDILLSSALFFIGLVGWVAMIDISTISPIFVLVMVVVSVLVAVLLHFRAWMLMAAIVSALIGAGGSVFLTLFSMFMGGSDNFWINWAVLSGLVFLFLAPVAWGAKKKFAPVDLGRKIPTAVIAAAACALLLLFGLFFRFFEA